MHLHGGVSLLVCTLLVGCATMESAWNRAEKNSTYEDYERFLMDYPDSIYADDARLQLEGRDWQSAQMKNSLKSYSGFLNKHPQGKHSEQAKVMLDKLARVNETFSNAV